MATPLVEKHNRVLTMSRSAAPAARMPAGSRIRLETADCFGDQIQGPADVERGIDWNVINPATGPVYVEGAQPGDVLAVRVEHIEVADHGVMCTGAGMGVLAERFDREHWRFVTVWDMEARWEGGFRFPIRPMIGVIGVAPGVNDVPCNTPGHHGGNLDTRLIQEGATIYFPVQVAGALLAAGDLHAAMGDGEIGVSGVEVAGRVTLHVDVRRDITLTDPLLENDDLVATIASAVTLDKAAEMATGAMADLLVGRLDMALADAVMLMSAMGNLRISQVVDPLKTARFEMRKNAYEGVFGRLL